MEKKKKIQAWWVLVVFAAVFLGKWVDGSSEYFNLTEELPFESLNGVSAVPAASDILMVDLTLIPGAAAKGAGTLSLSPQFHFG